jgi:hypothetical protein
MRTTIADLAADGGNAQVLVRRPSVQHGPLARQLEAMLYPNDGDGKGKGKGKKKGKGKPSKGKGKTKDAEAEMHPATGTPATTGEVRTRYADRPEDGDQEAKKHRSPTPLRLPGEGGRVSSTGGR